MAEKKNPEEEKVLIRVLGKDVRGDSKLKTELIKIKGISWAFSNAICKSMGIDGNKKVQDINRKDLDKIEEFVKNPEIPSFLKNRRKDFDSGEDKHLIGSDLKLKNEFDVKRLRNIRSYRGARHAVNLPVRGQRTKANFRRNRKPSVASAKRKNKGGGN